MVSTLSYQQYSSEHGLSTAGQRAADIRAGEAAAALRDLRLQLRRTLRSRHRVRTARRTADARTAPVQVLPSSSAR
jgi:hypothetical protein